MVHVQTSSPVSHLFFCPRSTCSQAITSSYKRARSPLPRGLNLLLNSLSLSSFFFTSCYCEGRKLHRSSIAFFSSVTLQFLLLLLPDPNQKKHHTDSKLKPFLSLPKKEPCNLQIPFTPYILWKYLWSWPCLNFCSSWSF